MYLLMRKVVVSSADVRSNGYADPILRQFVKLAAGVGSLSQDKRLRKLPANTAIALFTADKNLKELLSDIPHLIAENDANQYKQCTARILRDRIKPVRNDEDKWAIFLELVPNQRHRQIDGHQNSSSTRSSSSFSGVGNVGGATTAVVPVALLGSRRRADEMSPSNSSSTADTSNKRARR